jgi:hypothetical protein
MGVSWVFKSESILPIQPGEKKKKMALFGLQTVGFLGLEKCNVRSRSMHYFKWILSL